MIDYVKNKVVRTKGTQKKDFHHSKKCGTKITFAWNSIKSAQMMELGGLTIKDFTEI